MTTYKDMKSISFDGGQTVYNIEDETARNDLTTKQDTISDLFIIHQKCTKLR